MKCASKTETIAVMTRRHLFYSSGCQDVMRSMYDVTEQVENAKTELWGFSLPR